MKNIGLLLFIICNAFCAFSQTDITYSKINSIDWQMFNRSELQTIENAIDRKKIILLSESDHGHGSSIDAKCMILKDLIESKKISSIYLESNILNCEKISEILKEKGFNGIPETLKYMQSYELNYWVKNGFWNYLASKIIDRKITLFGIDIDGISTVLMSELFIEARQMPQIQKWIATNEEKFKEISFDLGEQFAGWQAGSMFYEKNFIVLKSFIDTVITVYQRNNDSTRMHQWKYVLNFFYWMFKRGDALKGNKYANLIENDKQFAAFHSVRDSFLARNFLEKYKMSNEDKVVCSISAFHALRHSSSTEELSICCKPQEIKTFGELIANYYKDEIYSICFVAPYGEYGAIMEPGHHYLKIIKPKSHSLEKKLSEIKNLEYCFIDLSTNSLGVQSFYMNVVFYKYLKSNWINNFSGIFYIRQMRPLFLYSNN